MTLVPGHESLRVWYSVKDRICLFTWDASGCFGTQHGESDHGRCIKSLIWMDGFVSTITGCVIPCLILGLQVM